MELQGSVAIVTGANHGIGAAAAMSLAAAGAKVLVSYLRLPVPPNLRATTIDNIRATATGEDVVAQIRSLGGEARAVEADLNDGATIAALFDQAESELGQVNIVVNNADLSVRDTFTVALDAASGTTPVFTPDRFIAHVRVNCGAPGAMIAELARRRHGIDAVPASVVNVSTDGSPGSSVRCPTARASSHWNL